MPPHKHCKYCGFDFEPKNQWDEFCPAPKKCVEDYQKVHPAQFPSQPIIQFPGWNMPQFPGQGPAFPNVTVNPPATWFCGICGRVVPANESHSHAFSFTTGIP